MVRAARWESAVLADDVEALAASLLDAPATIDTRNRYGQTPLMLAAAEGRTACVAWLIAQRAALDLTAKFGLSALMLAVLRGHVEVARLLVAAGADTAVRGHGAPGFADKTAADLARRSGSPAMRAAFLDRPG